LAVSVIISITILLDGLHNQRSKTFSYKLFNNTYGWGYDIFAGNKLFIHQETVPCVATNKGFDQRKQAQAAARLVIQKLENGRIPMISKTELGKFYPVNDMQHDPRKSH